MTSHRTLDMPPLPPEAVVEPTETADEEEEEEYASECGRSSEEFSPAGEAPAAFARWESEDLGTELELPESPTGELHSSRRGSLYNLGVEGGWLIHHKQVTCSTRMIGQGSVGSVFKGTLVATGQAVAIKCVRDDLTENTRINNRTIEDISTEVRIMAEIGSHPLVIEFIGALIPESRIPILVFEFLDGGSIVDTFRAKRKSKKLWRPPKVISFQWSYDLLGAIEYLHNRDTPLIHRDVKPSNMFCSADMRVFKLGDFGLCRSVKTSEDERCMTAMAGSLIYMAPEVFSGNYSEKADVFSAAVSMVYLITGEEPYSQEPDVLSGETTTNGVALRVAKEGYRMSLASVKYPRMASLISDLWDQDPMQRPSAQNATGRIDEMIGAVVQNSKKPLAWISRKTGIPNLVRRPSREEAPARSGAGSFSGSHSPKHDDPSPDRSDGSRKFPPAHQSTKAFRHWQSESEMLPNMASNFNKPVSKTVSLSELRGKPPLPSLQHTTSASESTEQRKPGALMRRMSTWSNKSNISPTSLADDEAGTPTSRPSVTPTGIGGFFNTMARQFRSPKHSPIDDSPTSRRMPALGASSPSSIREGREGRSLDMPASSAESMSASSRSLSTSSRPENTVDSFSDDLPGPPETSEI
mmetsp:Transcript_41858/g.99362  ORF Transcript_41858/g.99362 Transcript_41858/m.99362 type:complete len:639 (+) Transcript_41858:150-2066(+)